MILFTILALIALMLTLITVALISIGGTTFIMVFGDLIVCVVFIVLLMKLIFKKRKK